MTITASQRRLATFGAAALFATYPVLIPTASNAASSLLPCRANVSDATPKDYTNVYVTVHTVSYAFVRTTAHYKTTNTSHQAKAGPKGFATIRYYISSSTPGFRVRINVGVFKNGHTGYCSTSFVAHR